jgi:hypothetical protein
VRGVADVDVDERKTPSQSSVAMANASSRQAVRPAATTSVIS